MLYPRQQSKGTTTGNAGPTTELDILESFKPAATRAPIGHAFSRLRGAHAWISCE